MATVKKIAKAQMGKLVDKYKNFVKKGKDDSDYTKSSFKTADSLRSASPKLGAKGLKGLMEERKSNRSKADSIESAVEKRVGVPRKLNMYEQKNGGKTKKFEAGGSLSGLKASNKRVGPVDPKGAYTKVQKRTLAGAKGKAVLKKDKQLGATKMKNGGAMKKCKYGCK
jgi:hypothetical protein